MSDSTKTTVLDVNGHRVPVTAYKRIVELWRSGWPESEITQEAMSTMRNTDIGTITDVVLGAINDQKFAFTFSGTRKEYLQIPLYTPNAIRNARLALEQTRWRLARAESIEDEHALEAVRLMGRRAAITEGTRTHLERMERQAQIDRMTKEALQKRQKAEEDVLHLKEVEKIRVRLLALSLS